MFFDQWLRTSKQSGLFIFRHACPPLEDVHLIGDGGKCFSFDRVVLGFLDRSPFIKHVALISTWRQVIESVLTDEEGRSLSTEESILLFKKKFARTLQHLKDQDKKVYIWEPLPGAKQSVPQALAKIVLSRNVGDIKIQETEYLSTYKFFFDALVANRSLIERSFSPSKVLCSSGACSILIDNTPLYFDNNHITKSSTDFWVKMLNSYQIEY